MKSTCSLFVFCLYRKEKRRRGVEVLVWHFGLQASCELVYCIVSIIHQINRAVSNCLYMSQSNQRQEAKPQSADLTAGLRAAEEAAMIGTETLQKLSRQEG